MAGWMGLERANEIKFGGITSSPVLVGEHEWFMRMLKERVIWGRRFEILDEAGTDYYGNAA